MLAEEEEEEVVGQQQNLNLTTQSIVIVKREDTFVQIENENVYLLPNELKSTTALKEEKECTQ